jgi:PAS domain S-box-containing protein
VKPCSELLARIIAEHVCDGIVLTDIEGLIVWVNPAFTTLSEYELDELLGKRPGDVLQAPRRAPESRAAMAAAIARKEFIKVDVVNYTKIWR